MISLAMLCTEIPFTHVLRHPFFDITYAPSFGLTTQSPSFETLAQVRISTAELTFIKSVTTSAIPMLFDRMTRSANFN